MHAFRFSLYKYYFYLDSTSEILKQTETPETNTERTTSWVTAFLFEDVTKKQLPPGFEGIRPPHTLYHAGKYNTSFWNL